MLLSLFGFAALGAITASFVGVLAGRLYTGQAWAKSRSRCDSCARVLGMLDLVPVVSWLLSCGCCRTCGSKVSAQHLLFEVALAALFALSFLKLGFTPALLPFLLALSVLTFIVLYDLRHTLVPPEASTTLAVFSLWFAYLASPGTAFGSALAWAGGIGLAFLALHVFSKGRAMGLADAPVAFSLALLSAPYAFTGLLCSFWIGALYGIIVLVLRRKQHTIGTEVPFVPFLALGFLLAYFTQWNLLPL